MLWVGVECCSRLGPESGNMALCVWYEGCCLTGFFKWCVGGVDMLLMMGKKLPETC